jgi:hypothetical protein
VVSGSGGGSPSGAEGPEQRVLSKDPEVQSTGFGGSQKPCTGKLSGCL